MHQKFLYIKLRRLMRDIKIKSDLINHNVITKLNINIAIFNNEIHIRICEFDNKNKRFLINLFELLKIFYSRITLKEILHRDIIMC